MIINSSTSLMKFFGALKMFESLKYLQLLSIDKNHTPKLFIYDHQIDINLLGYIRQQVLSYFSMQQKGKVNKGKNKRRK